MAKPLMVQHMVHMVIQTTDINTKPSFNRTTDPDMASSSSLSLSDWHRLSSSMVARSNMAPGSSPDPQAVTWLSMITGAMISTQILAAIGPQTQTWLTFSLRTHIQKPRHGDEGL